MVKENKNIPEGIWILSVLSFLGAGLLVLFGWISLSMYDLFRGTLGWPVVDAAGVITYISPGRFLLIGILLIAIGVLVYYLAKGLLKSKNWAKITIAIISVLGIIFSLITLMEVVYLTTIVAILIDGLIIWYLFFKDSTKKYFK